jgi:hypothetical protein
VPELCAHYNCRYMNIHQIVERKRRSARHAQLRHYCMRAAARPPKLGKRTAHTRAPLSSGACISARRRIPSHAATGNGAPSAAARTVAANALGCCALMTRPALTTWPRSLTFNLSRSACRQTRPCCSGLRSADTRLCATSGAAELPSRTVKTITCTICHCLIHCTPAHAPPLSRPPRSHRCKSRRC